MKPDSDRPENSEPPPADGVAKAVTSTPPVAEDAVDTAESLPAHAVAFNAIGDADLCADALRQAEDILARSNAPIINPPAPPRRSVNLTLAPMLSGPSARTS